MLRACLILALASCAFAGYVGYPYTYSVAAPTYAAYHAPLAAVSTVHHTPAFTYGYGYPSFNYGLGSYGLSYGYGLGGLGYTTLLKK
nr:glycine-rich protein-like [Dermacentor andersoni]